MSTLYLILPEMCKIRQKKNRCINVHIFKLNDEEIELIELRTQNIPKSADGA